MLGLMQDWPMTLDRVLDHAKITNPDREIVSRSIEGPLVRTTYGEMWGRAKQVSHALREAGIGMGDRVATLAWNTARHMEVWFGAMGIGAVLHTLNPRLLHDQIAWIANHAGDRVLVVDLTFVPIVEKIQNQLASVERFVILTDRAHMPQTTLKNAVAYEDFIAGRPQDVRWGGFDENTARKKTCWSYSSTSLVTVSDSLA